jgi:20S proteasome alpha/beta subunit
MKIRWTGKVREGSSGSNRLDSSIDRWDDEWFGEEPPMSLCIAATCRYEFNPCILYCCDTAGTRGDVKSEDVNKIRHVGDTTVLLAGSMSDARELLAMCSPFIKKYQVGGDDIAITRLKQDLTEAVRLRKRAIATEVLSAESGLSYDEVFNWSQAHPDDPTYVRAWQKIRELGLNAALIVGTFTDDEVAILTIEPNGRIVWSDHYAAVGTGSSVAEAFLHQRDYNDWMDFQECLYRVLEAKTAAEKNPHVGKETRVQIRTMTGFHPVNSEYVDELCAMIRSRREELPDIKLDPKYLKTALDMFEELQGSDDAASVE